MLLLLIKSILNSVVMQKQISLFFIINTSQFFVVDALFIGIYIAYPVLKLIFQCFCDFNIVDFYILIAGCLFFFSFLVRAEISFLKCKQGDLIDH